MFLFSAECFIPCTLSHKPTKCLCLSGINFAAIVNSTRYGVHLIPDHPPLQPYT
jgi:hypothetical protein